MPPRVPDEEIHRQIGEIIRDIPEGRLWEQTRSDYWNASSRVEASRERSRKALFQLVYRHNFFDCGGWPQYLAEFHGLSRFTARHGAPPSGYRRTVIADEQLHREVRLALEALPLATFENELRHNKWVNGGTIPGHNRSRFALVELCANRKRRGKAYFGHGSWTAYLNAHHAGTISRIREFTRANGFELPKPLAAHSPEELLALGERIAGEREEEPVKENDSNARLPRTPKQREADAEVWRLVTENERLMHSIVRRFVQKYPYREETIREAAKQGLFNAAAGFDRNAGRFSTYAVPTITGTIQTALKRERRHVSLDSGGLDEGLHEWVGAEDPRFSGAETRLDAVAGARRLLELHEARRLSANQIMVILLDSYGLGSTAIGRALGGISRQHVHNHLNAARKVLDAETRRGLALAAGD